MTKKSNTTILNSLNDRVNSVFLGNKLESAITFVSTTTGTVATHKIADVTGVVAMQVFAICGTNLVGASTIEVGTALSTAALIAQTTGTDIDANEIWHDASPDSSIELTSVVTQKIVTQDINYKIGAAAISAGVLTFYILWSPISDDGNVELA